MVIFETLSSKRYGKLYIWLWKFKFKVVAKVEPNGYILGLDFNRYVWALFHGNETIFGWDMANFTIDLENSKSRSQQKSTKISIW